MNATDKKYSEDNEGIGHIFRLHSGLLYSPGHCDLAHVYRGLYGLK